MYELTVRTRFSAAHHLEGYPGACAAHHGHNWGVEVSVAGEKLDGTGMLVDFRKVKDAVADVIDPLDHVDLSQLKPFQEMNPTCEHIACYIYKGMQARFADDACRVSRVTVRETPESSASYSEP